MSCLLNKMLKPLLQCISDRLPQEKLPGSTCRLTLLGEEYVGTVNTTQKGKPCLRWNSVVSVLASRDVSISQAENFCRNPDLNVEGPWCYVQGEKEIIKETCHVSFCKSKYLNHCFVVAFVFVIEGKKMTVFVKTDCFNILSS